MRFLFFFFLILIIYNSFIHFREKCRDYYIFDSISKLDTLKKYLTREESLYSHSNTIMILSHLPKDQGRFSPRHSVCDTAQRGNRSVDPRCKRLCIAKLIVHIDAHTFEILVDDVITCQCADLVIRKVIPHVTAGLVDAS